MILENRRAWIALFALLWIAPVATAQTATATATAREYLRADLRVESLIEEAFRAAKRVQDDQRSAHAARTVVARELLARGRSEDARVLLDRAAIAVRGNLRFPYAVATVGELYGQAYTFEEMHEFLISLPERGGRVPAAIGFLRGCVKRNDSERLRRAIGHLSAASYIGWSPEADAWLAIGWKAFGNEDFARSYENKVLEGPYSKEYESDSGTAIQALVRRALDLDDLDEACRLVDTYVSSPKVQGKDLFAVGWNSILVVRALSADGQFDRARERAQRLKSGMDRATALAEVGAALWKHGGPIAAEKDLLEAGAIAKRVSLLSRCRVAEVLGRHGLDEAATALAWDALGSLIEEEKGPVRETGAGFLAQTFLKLGHVDAIALFESELSEQNSIDFVVTLAGVHAEQENLDGLLEIIDGLWAYDDQSEDTIHGTLAARTALRKLADREQGDRFAAELLRALVERARAAPADRRALLLGEVLENRIAEPVRPHSYHPWSAPPTLAGDWRTPADPTAAAALLEGALGEFPMPQVRGIRSRALRFHPDAQIFEFDGFRGGLRYHYLLLRVGENATLLNGPKEVLDAAALEASWRDSDEALFDLVHVAISSRAGKSGRFRVIEGLDVLEELRAPGATLPALKLKGTELIERREDGATLEANLLVARQLERITVTVLDGGQVSLAPKELIAKDLPLELEYYIGGGYERRHDALGKVWPIHATDEASWAFEMAKLHATGFGEGGWRCDPSLAFYFLDIAKRKGHPNPIQRIGHAWRDGDGVAADVDEAIEWLVTAASRGNLDACCDAADLLLASPSPERRDRARTVLQFGKDGGDERAAARLAELDAVMGEGR